MKKKILSALLTVVMIITMLTAMCPGVLAAQTVNVDVGVTYTNASLDPITSESDLGLISSDATNPGVVETTSDTKNGITVTAVVSADKKSITLTYSGTPLGSGLVDFTIKYCVGGNMDNPSSHVITFNAVQQKTEALLPEITSAEPTNLNLTLKQTDPAANFTVAATGNGEISYRWRVDGTEVATSGAFTLVPEDMDVGAHTVECVVNNTVDNTTKFETVTWNVTIEEGDAPKITSEVTSGKIDGTGSASFVVTAEGDDLKYQWYLVSGSKKEKVVDGTYGAIEYTGATTNKLTVKCKLAPQDASTKFVCEVTGANGLSTTTEEYKLKITEDPNAEKVQEIVIVKGPEKTSYVVGETLDADGLKIKVVTGKDEEELTSGFVCSPLYLEEEGTQTITVSYGGKTTTFTVTVEAAPHEHEWSDWKVDNGTSVKVFRECIAGDDCTAKEVLSKDTFIVEYPTIAAELGLTMGDDTTDTGSDEPADNDKTEVDTEVPADNEKDNGKDKNKNNGSGILWAIIIIALILLAAVIFYYLKVYRKPYKKPTNNNRKR